MKFMLLMIVLLANASAFGQTRIYGVVKGPEGEPVPGANVLIEGTYDGTTSAADGSFQFETSEKGTFTLVVKFIGYKTFSEQVELTGGAIQRLISMKEEISELDAVTITAGSFTASDASRRTVFRAVDIATTAGATADIAGALNTLPGTQKVGETGRLFVRGGDDSESRTFIDGMVVLDAYGPAAPNTPSRGRFLPFMFKGTSFSTGGYSAEWGQALSSVLALDSKDESEITRTDIGLLSVGADIAHTQAWERGSAAAKLQFTNLSPYTGLVRQDIEWKDAPASMEGVAAVRQRIGKAGMVKFYGNFNDADFSLYRTDLDNPSAKHLLVLENRYRYFNGSARAPLGTNWIMRGGLSYSSIADDVAVSEAFQKKRNSGVHGKVVAEGSLLNGLDLKTGAEVLREKFSLTDPGQSTELSSVLTALFAEADIVPLNKMAARTGLRYEHHSRTGEVTVDPRLSVAWKVASGGQVSLAWGTFSQAARNNYAVISPGMKSERASHWILNYQFVKENRTFRVEAYYKDYKHLARFSSNSVDNTGYGFAKGIELFWRDNTSVRGLDYWVSYSFLDTEREYLHFPAPAVPSFASAHNFSIVTKYFVQRLKSQLGATWSFASGRPYHNPNETGFMEGRTPAYNDLSFNWSYLPKPWLIVFLSCTNLTGRDNIFGYEYSNVRDDQGMFRERAIRQPAPRFLFAGIFITLSKDKTMNQLPAL